MKTKTESKHTPTPWVLSEDKTKAGNVFIEAHDASATVGTANPKDAAFIVRAVNSHEALLEIAKKALGRCAYPGCPECIEDQKAIAQAEGK